MEIQRVCNKTQTTGFTRKQVGQIRFCQKTCKRVWRVLRKREKNKERQKQECQSVRVVSAGK